MTLVHFIHIGQSPDLNGLISVEQENRVDITPHINYPAGSYKVTAVGNSFSPGDISGLIGNSYVAARTGAHYMLPGGTIIN